MAGLDDVAERKEWVEAIRTAGAGLYALLNDVLDIARLDSGEAPRERADLDIRAVADSVRSLCRPTAWARELDLEVAIDRAVPQRLTGDAGRIRQTLLNLTGNALKFTERGGVSVTVTLHAVRRDRIVAEVRDTGIGIPLESQAKIFDSFSQADGSTTRKYGGTGLGLAIVKQLVELMGGHVELESTPGIGTAFRFTMPIDTARCRTAALDGTPVGNSGSEPHRIQPAA